MAADQESPASGGDSDKGVNHRSDEYRRKVLDFIQTSPVEARLLSHLLKNSGVLAPSPEILVSVWGQRGNPGLLRYYITRLRAKLKGAVEWRITTVRGQGYRLDFPDAQTRQL